MLSRFKLWMACQIALYLYLFVSVALVVTFIQKAETVVIEPSGSGEKLLNRHKRIIGGYPVKRGTFPWAVSIQARRPHEWPGQRSHYCGGALIAPKWVVTAAHCLYEEDETVSFLDPKLWHVRMASETLFPSTLERAEGLLNRALNALVGGIRPQAFYHVRKIFHHPKFEPGSLEYDIALFQLKETPILNKLKNVDMIDLPSPELGENWPTANQTCSTVGWGCSFANGPATLQVQAVELPVLDPDTCNQMYSAYINLTTAHEFCAGYHLKGIGICPGDSGGPLVCKGPNNNLLLAGIVSATHSNNPEDYPAVFTRISYFTDWIQEVMRKNPPPPKFNFITFANLINLLIN